MVDDEGVEFVDLRFCDLPGVMQHVSIPATVLDEGQFEEGHAFDGSSVRGFQQIQESDMVLVADPNTAYLDPFRARKTLVLHCDVADPVTGERYSRDPRYVAKKAEEYLFSTGIADTAYFGPEPEFFIFDDVRFETTGNASFYEVDSVEGQWNTGRDEGPNLGYKPRTKEGYFPAPPMDHYQDLRSEMSATLQQVGIPIELHHHEVASGGQGEIGIRFDTLLRHGRQADDVQVRPEERGVAPRQVAHVHAEADLRRQRLGHAHPPVAVEGRRAAVLRRDRLRRAVRHRPLVHRRAAAPRARRCSRSPTRRRTRYKRLVPGYEAPVNLVYSQRNRSASCRIPLGQRSPRAKRVEFRCPDSTSNPYLAFSAMLLAGLDGIRNRIEPPDARRQGPLRPPARGARRRAPGARLARGGAATPSRPTTTSSAPAASSPTTSSRPGSPTSASTRSTRSACARTPTSSRSTTTSRHQPATL